MIFPPLSLKLKNPLFQHPQKLFYCITCSNARKLRQEDWCENYENGITTQLHITLAAEGQKKL